MVNIFTPKDVKSDLENLQFKIKISDFEGIILSGCKEADEKTIKHINYIGSKLGQGDFFHLGRKYLINQSPKFYNYLISIGIDHNLLYILSHDVYLDPVTYNVQLR